MKKLNVLITCAGSATAQCIIKALTLQDEIDVNIAVADCSYLAAGNYLADRYFIIPRATDPDFLDKLVSICDEAEIDLLIPVMDREFPVIAENRKRFNCTVALSSFDTIMTCLDKLQLYSFFVQHDIPTPFTVWGTYCIWPYIGLFRYPLFIKPNMYGRASIDTHRIDTPDELRLKISKHMNHYLIQEYLEGDEFTVDVLNDFDGKTIAVVPRWRSSVKAGVSYIGETFRDSELTDYAVKIAEGLKIVGHCNIQGFYKDCYKFTEVNPRYSGGMMLTYAAGVNSPLLLAKMAMGEEVKSCIGRFRSGVTMMRYVEEVFISPHSEIFSYNWRWAAEEHKKEI